MHGDGVCGNGLADKLAKTGRYILEPQKKLWDKQAHTFFETCVV